MFSVFVSFLGRMELFSSFSFGDKMYPVFGGKTEKIPLETNYIFHGQ
jgi:hypothetical protein